eukprot:365408-Chlamydomonas_euryale.AAC.12
MPLTVTTALQTKASSSCGSLLACCLDLPHRTLVPAPVPDQGSPSLPHQLCLQAGMAGPLTGAAAMENSYVWICMSIIFTRVCSHAAQRAHTCAWSDMQAAVGEQNWC